MDEVASRIFELLDNSSMDQKTFAERIGSTDKIVSKWRTSGLKSYRKYLPQIAEALNTSVNYILNGTKKEPIAPEGDGLINTITFSRNGKIVKKQYSPEKWKTIIEMLDAIPEDKLP